MNTKLIPFEVVAGDSTKHPDVIAALPLLGDATELLLDCAATGAIGVISGPPGSGKSVALRRLAARYAGMSLPGAAFYYCCQSNAGPTRGLKDLLAEMGIGGAIIASGHGASMQLLLKLALRDFMRKNIRCLLLDESDRWDAEAVTGMLALHDHLRERGHQISLLFASMSDFPEWMSQHEAARSRTLRVLRAERVTASQMIGLLGLWGDEFSGAVDDDVVHLIHERTGGDLRRLNFFARLHARHFRGKPACHNSVTSTLKRLDEE